MIPTIGLMIGLLLPAPATGAQKDGATTVAVYVFTESDPSGFDDALQQQRQESVEQITNRLRKKKGIAIVEQRDDADLLVEVLDSRRKDAGIEHTANPGFGVSRTEKQQQPAVHVALRVADYTFEMESSERRWSLAARALADEVERWIKQNRAKLTRQ